MLKTLRNKFIKIAMLSVAAVLVVIIISINFANYIQITKTSNTKISLIAQNDGIFPNLSNDKDSPDKNIPNKKDLRPRMNLWKEKGNFHLNHLLTQGILQCL